jgi:hypothetical protein
VRDGENSALSSMNSPDENDEISLDAKRCWSSNDPLAAILLRHRDESSPR